MVNFNNIYPNVFNVIGNFDFGLGNAGDQINLYDNNGGYVLSGILGHGDAFALRDPHGIRPAYYHQNEEIVVVASERPVIQTAVNIRREEIKELPRGQAIIVKKNGSISRKRSS